MPLPLGAYKFLDVAVPLLRDRGAIHLYYWSPQENGFTEAEKLIAEAAAKHGRSAEFMDHTRVSQYSPGTWKLRLNARLLMTKRA